jgi:hypothetical protein
MPELKITITAENQKALDELKQLQDKLFKLQETVKNYKGDWPLTHTIETAIPKIQGRITELQGTLTKAGVAFDNFGNDTQKIAIGSNRAGLALNDLSRIAQDAPYGFIGISNNLNPMIESFGRLVDKEKGVKNALASMASSLTGPAGIGLAVGVVSALLVVFSKQITEAFQKPTDKLKEFYDELNKINAKVYEVVGQAQANKAIGGAYVDAITGTGDIKVKENALNKLKELFKENADIQKIKITDDKNYLLSLLNTAASQQEWIGKEKLNNEALRVVYTDKFKLEDERRIKLLKLSKSYEEDQKKLGTSASTETKIFSEQQNKAKIAEINNDIDSRIKSVMSNLPKAIDAGKRINDALLGFNFTEKKNTTATVVDNSVQDAYKGIMLDRFASERLKRNMKGQDLSLIFLDTPESVVAKEKKRVDSIKTLLRPVIDRMAEEGGLGDILSKKAAPIAEKNKADDEEFKRKGKEKLKVITDQENAYKQFAKTISSSVTNSLVGMYDAMQKGENPVQALTDSFARLAEQLAASVIQALIFRAVMAGITGGVSEIGGATTGLASIADYIMAGISPHATGGITTGPSVGLIGEAGPEAIMPLSKLSSFLNTSFNAGAMKSNSSGNGGQFVLRGQDLLVALNRTQKASNLKGQSISLA